MEIQEKFSLVMTPNKSQRDFAGLSEVTLYPSIHKFNDGSLKVTLPGIPQYAPIRHQYFTIRAFIESLDDLMVVAQIKDIVRNNCVSQIQSKFDLEIAGTAYTRYDRVMHSDKSDAFGAKVFADFVNSLKFDTVVLEDAHSKVIENWIENSYPILQADMVRSLVDDYESYCIVAPDKGSLNKAEDPLVICDKNRDPETGKILGMKVAHVAPEASQFEKFLIVDDICEGGGTFLGLADAFRAHSAEFDRAELNIYVTHGIFSNNAIPKLLEKYSNIYVYNMKAELYNSLTETQRSRVHFHTLYKS